MSNKVAMILGFAVVVAVLVGGVITLQLKLDSSEAKNAQLSQNLVITDAHVASVQEENAGLKVTLSQRTKEGKALESQITALQQEVEQKSSLTVSFQLTLSSSEAENARLNRELVSIHNTKIDNLNYYYALLMTNALTVLQDYVPLNSKIVVDHGPVGEKVTLTTLKAKNEGVIITLPNGLAHHFGVWPFAKIYTEKRPID